MIYFFDSLLPTPEIAEKITDVWRWFYHCTLPLKISAVSAIVLCDFLNSSEYGADFAAVFEHQDLAERWGAVVETQKNVRGEIGGWGRVPFNEPYAPLLSTIYDGA